MRPFENFSAGLWLPGDVASSDPQPGFAVPENALLEADNLEYLPSSGVRGRRGRTRINGTPYPAGTVVRALHRFYPRPDTETTTAATPQTVDLAAGPGAIEWTITGGTLTVPATVTLNDGETPFYLRLRSFGLVLDPAATIVGIAVTITRRATGTTPLLTDASVTLTLDPDTLLTPAGERAQLGTWATTWETVTYGGPADLWGRAWQVADLTTDTFGVVLAPTATSAGATAEVSAVTVTVYTLRAERPVVTLVARTWGTTSTIGVLFPHDPDQVEYAPLTSGRNAMTHARLVAWPEHGATYAFDGVNPTLKIHSSAPMNIPVASEIVVSADSLAVPLGPYATLHQNRLWATQPAELGFSVYGSEVNDPTRWYGDIQLSLNDALGGSITGLVSLTGQTPLLLILKDTSLWYYVGDPLSGGQLVRFSRVGCQAPDSVALTPFGVVFVGTDGVFLTDGQTAMPTRISDPLGSLFVGRTADSCWKTAVGVYYPKKQQYWLKLDPTAAEGYVCQFLGQSVAWSRMPVMPMQAATVYSAAADDGQLVLAGADGWIRQADVGTTDDDGTEAGQPIPVMLRTGSHVLDDRTPQLREGRACYIKPQYRGAAGLTGTLRYQDDPTRVVPFTITTPAVLGFQTPRATITEMETFGRVVDIRLLNATDGPDFELHRIGADVQLRTVRSWR